MNHQAGVLQALHLGRVLDNSDPETRGRLQVEILNTGMQLWATCMTSSAGQGYGISCLPKVDEIVVLAFLSPELPVVLGAKGCGKISVCPQDKSCNISAALVSLAPGKSSFSLSELALLPKSKPFTCARIGW